MVKKSLGKDGEVGRPSGRIQLKIGKDPWSL